MKEYTQLEWLTEGDRLFGPNRKDWKFVCASCGTPQSAVDFLEHGVSKDEVQRGIVGFSCIGRYTEGKIGCDWTLGGLLQIHKALVITDEGERIPVFEFYSEVSKR